ncbi:MAG: hypothetical protein N2109_10165 [Fimbriimonadales bacterium]|nr:hypothetical protein [Fimbriimonadales bacterium]
MDLRFELALRAAEGLEATPANIRRLSERLGEDAARWGFLQWELRRRARAKFGHADRMLFDREGLEMASAEELARRHASLFPSGELVADLTVGIGADLIALAGRGPAVGFEKDPERAELARHNLRALGLEARVLAQDCLMADWGFSFAFADPARRSAAGRSADPLRSDPPLDALLPRLRELRLAVLKLSPMARDEQLARLGACIEFLGCGWECREALAILGAEAAGAGTVRAALADGSTLLPEPCPDAAAEPGSVLLEAHPAAIRAGCLGALCRSFGLRPLGDSNGYLTAEAACRSPWLRSYAVVWSGPADRKHTQAALRRLAGRVTDVKHRAPGPPRSPRSLRAEGERRLLLAVWSVGRSLRHTLIEGPLQP